MKIRDEWVKAGLISRNAYRTWAVENGFEYALPEREMVAVIEAVAPLIRQAALEEAALLCDAHKNEAMNMGFTDGDRHSYDAYAIRQLKSC